jgi:hypothetical protein
VAALALTRPKPRLLPMPGQMVLARADGVFLALPLFARSVSRLLFEPPYFLFRSIVTEPLFAASTRRS